MPLHIEKVRELKRQIDRMKRTLGIADQWPDQRRAVVKAMPVASGWHVTKENRAKLVADLKEADPDLSDQDADYFVDCVFKLTTPDIWR